MKKQELEHSSDIPGLQQGQSQNCGFMLIALPEQFPSSVLIKVNGSHRLKLIDTKVSRFVLNGSGNDLWWWYFGFGIIKYIANKSELNRVSSRGSRRVDTKMPSDQE